MKKRVAILAIVCVTIFLFTSCLYQNNSVEKSIDGMMNALKQYEADSFDRYISKEQVPDSIAYGSEHIFNTGIENEDAIYRSMFSKMSWKIENIESDDTTAKILLKITTVDLMATLFQVSEELNVQVADGIISLDDADYLYYHNVHEKIQAGTYDVTTFDVELIMECDVEGKWICILNDSFMHAISGGIMME